VAAGFGLIHLLPALFVPAPGFVETWAFRFDGRVLIFSLLVTGAAVVILGVLPSCRAPRFDVIAALKGASRSVSPARAGMRRWLVIA
jgi:ABC-type antimicrobial peptide transport system permease subunit